LSLPLGFEGKKKEDVNQIGWFHGIGFSNVDKRPRGVCVGKHLRRKITLKGRKSHITFTQRGGGGGWKYAGSGKVEKSGQ